MRQRGLLLDRDGVINLDGGYVGTRERFHFTPGVFPFLRRMTDNGYRLAIVTNQAGVAHNYYTRQDFEDLTAWMLEEFRREQIVIDRVFACFEHKDAVTETYRRGSFWRKPNPGMILDSAQTLGFDLARSAMIGDQETDMQAAQAAGVGMCLWLNTDGKTKDGVKTVKTLDEAAGLLCGAKG